MDAAESGAPPPPGADTPVPVDAAARAAAAGRALRARQGSAPAATDGLVPTTPLEQRAAARAARRHSAPPWWAQPATAQVGNPAAGMPTAPTAMLPPGLAPAVAEAMPQRFVPPAWQQPPQQAAPWQQPAQQAAPWQQPPQQATPWQQPAWQPPVSQSPAAWAPQPWSAWPQPQHPTQRQPAPYPAPQWQGQGQGQGQWQGGPGMPPQVVLLPLPPRIRWTGRQRGAALLGSWAGQTLMALATHLLVAATLVVALAALIIAADGSVDEISGDTLSSTVALWSSPDRLWATALVVPAACGALLAIGWLVQALWQQHAGLAKPHRATWLAWLCTTGATGLVGSVLWPPALVAGIFVLFANDDASFTTGSLWTVLFVELAIAVVLTGGVGLLFGWLFLSTARPRIDPQQQAAAEEAAARARDEAELLRGRERWAAP